MGLEKEKVYFREELLDDAMIIQIETGAKVGEIQIIARTSEEY